MGVMLFILVLAILGTFFWLMFFDDRPTREQRERTKRIIAGVKAQTLYADARKRRGYDSGPSPASSRLSSTPYVDIVPDSGLVLPIDYSSPLEDSGSHNVHNHPNSFEFGGGDFGGGGSGGGWDSGGDSGGSDSGGGGFD